MENIKNLVIDFGGVLINLARNRCIEAFEAIGVADIRNLIVNNYLHKDLFKSFETGTITTRQFREAVRRLSSQILTDKQIDDAWISMLDDVPAYKLDLLLELRQKYNTMLLSNTNELHWHWAEQHIFTYKNHQASDFFHHTYLSYQLHLVEPDPEIFNYVIRDAGILPEETLFMDDAAPNCKTAGLLGFHTYMPKAHEDWSHLFITH